MKYEPQHAEKPNLIRHDEAKSEKWISWEHLKSVAGEKAHQRNATKHWSINILANKRRSSTASLI